MKGLNVTAIYLSISSQCHTTNASSSGMSNFVLFILLLLSSTGSKVHPPGCKLSLPKVDSYFMDGDYILGYSMPVHATYMSSKMTFTEPEESRLCTTLDPLPYQHILTMVYATTAINGDHSLIPNVTLGFKVLDSCYSQAFAVENAIRLLNEGEMVAPNYNCAKQRKILTVIAEYLSTLTVPVATMLSIYRFPQISHAAGLPVLSDKQKFPSFLRTTGSIGPQRFGLTEFVRHFGWTWIGILYAADDFNVEGSQQLKETLAEANICVAFFEIIPTNINKKNINSLVEKVATSSAVVVIIFSYPQEVALIMEEMSTQNVMGKVWIAASGWTDDTVFSKKQLWSVLNGTIGFAMPSMEIPELKDFLYSISPSRYPYDIYMKTFWETVFICKWLDNKTTTNMENEGKTAVSQLCTGEENLETLQKNTYPVDSFTFQYNMLNAVYATAHALHDMFSCSPGEGPFSNRTCADKRHFQPWQFLHYIKNVIFKNVSGKQVYFDENGDVPVLFDIINWQINSGESMRSVKIGTFEMQRNLDPMLIISHSGIMWSGRYTQVPSSDCSNTCQPGHRKSSIQGMPFCCYDCVPCSDGEFANQTDADSCNKCPDDSWPDEKKVICKVKTVEYLSFDDPLGATLTSLTISFSLIPVVILCTFIKYRDTPIVKANNRSLSYFLLVALSLCFLCSLVFIGKPSTASCLLRQSAFGVTFSICVSSIFAKTITVVIIFSAAMPGGFHQKCLGSKTPSFIGCFCAVLQIIVCTVWLGCSPPFPEQNKDLFKDKIIIECNEASIAMFYLMLGYLGLLSSTCLAAAFLVRKLPDRYNEAKFITFSMLIFVSVWLSFIPAYLSTKGKYVVAVEIFAILSSGFGLMSCIFFPKCYIILWRPDMNIKESVAWRSN